MSWEEIIIIRRRKPENQTWLMVLFFGSLFLIALWQSHVNNDSNAWKQVQAYQKVLKELNLSTSYQGTDPEKKYYGTWSFDSKDGFKGQVKHEKNDSVITLTMSLDATSKFEPYHMAKVFNTISLTTVGQDSLLDFIQDKKAFEYDVGGAIWKVDQSRKHITVEVKEDNL